MALIHRRPTTKYSKYIGPAMLLDGLIQTVTLGRYATGLHLPYVRKHLVEALKQKKAAKERETT